MVYVAKWGFSGGSAVKNLPANAGEGIWSLGQEDSLEKEMATTPAFLPGKSCEQRSLVGHSPWGRRAEHDLVTKQQQQ